MHCLYYDWFYFLLLLLLLLLLEMKTLLTLPLMRYTHIPRTEKEHGEKR